MLLEAGCFLTFPQLQYSDTVSGVLLFLFSQICVCTAGETVLRKVQDLQVMEGPGQSRAVGAAWAAAGRECREGVPAPLETAGGVPAQGRGQCVLGCRLLCLTGTRVIHGPAEALIRCFPC